MKHENQQIILEYPFTTAAAILLLGIALPCLILGIFLLIAIFLESVAILSIPGLFGGVLTLIGILVILVMFRMARTPDKLIIDPELGIISRHFGLSSLYGKFKGKSIKFEVNSIDKFVLSRKIHFIQTTEGPPAPLYHLYCGYFDFDGKEQILHAGNQQSIDTVKYLSQTYKKDIIDLTALEERKIPYTHLKALDEVRYPPISFIKQVLFRFGLIILLFLIGILVPLIFQNILTGDLKEMVYQLAGLLLLASVILFILFVIWIFKTIPKENMRCKQCGTFFSLEDESCLHCGLNIALMRSREYNIDDYTASDDYW